MTGFYILCGVMALVWLAGFAAGLLALVWCCTMRERSRLAIVLSILALVLGCLGMLFFRFRYSKTVNGSGWTVDSKWLFLALVLLGAVSLALTIWKWMNSRRALELN